MYLRGQGGQRGYAMAALLVALGVMAVLMTAAMPVWRHESQRERELETIFRGQQIARSIAMYREKNGGNLPSSIDLLVQQRFLRKKYKDLFAEDGEWVPIGGGGTQAQPGIAGGQSGRGGQAQPGIAGGQSGRGGQPQPGAQQPGAQQPGAQQPGQPGQSVGIMGVTLKDKGTAIVEYKRGTHHNEWTFMFSDTRSRIGGSQGGRSGGPGGVPGQPGRGGRPGGPGGAGTGPGVGSPGGGRGPGGRGVGPGGAPPGPFGVPGGRRGGGD